MIYLANYNENGEIQGFYIQGIHSEIPTPYITITAEQHAEFFANGQSYRVIDGVITYVEPAAQTAEEIKDSKIAALDAKYQPQFADLAQAWAVASMAKNADIATAREADLVALQAEYDQKRGEFKNGY